MYRFLFSSKWLGYLLLACGEHRAWLEDYLQTRGLWKETVVLGEETVPLPAVPAPLDPSGRIG